MKHPVPGVWKLCETLALQARRVVHEFCAMSERCLYTKCFVCPPEWWPLPVIRRAKIHDEVLKHNFKFIIRVQLDINVLVSVTSPFLFKHFVGRWRSQTRGCLQTVCFSFWTQPLQDHNSYALSERFSVGRDRNGNNLENAICVILIWLTITSTWLWFLRPGRRCIFCVWVSSLQIQLGT